MKITCLGSGGYYATNDTHTICFMIPELGIIIDAGTGLFRAIDLVKTENLHIFITHPHSDHTTGLAYLNLFYKKTSVKNIFIHASEFTLSTINNIFKPPFIGSPLKYTPAIFNTDSIKLFDNVVVSRFPVHHSVECYGYHFNFGDRSLAFITDTCSNESSEYAQCVDHSNLLIHECYLPDSKVDPHPKKPLAHTSSSGLIEFCKKANITNVCFIHHNPDGYKNQILEEVRKGIKNVCAANDQESYEI
ncbi:hypothetical protein M9Y10_046055 [Tritrichomonas musculus]|uniref:Metallo-beta-lactamase domain-containing protein n=1 Tax=Tritrichomonas musculus TaxID=1915356 RepID=A0ABR2JX31_9EUKA